MILTFITILFISWVWSILWADSKFKDLSKKVEGLERNKVSIGEVRQEILEYEQLCKVYTELEERGIENMSIDTNHLCELGLYVEFQDEQYSISSNEGDCELVKLKLAILERKKK
jgi:hypothetical protein